MSGRSTWSEVFSVIHVAMPHGRFLLVREIAGGNIWEILDEC